MVKKISEEWKTCQPDLKEKYVEEAARLAKEYGQVLQKYHMSLSEENLEAIREAKAKVREARHAKGIKKVCITS